MSECLDADKILDIGDALDWKVEEGLSHLQTCTSCRTHLETFQRTRAGLMASSPVDPAALARISASLREASRAELHHARRRTPLQQAAEACAAGLAALLVLVSNGVPVGGPGRAAVGFSLGAILMVTGTALARRLPTLGTPGTKV